MDSNKPDPSERPDGDGPDSRPDSPDTSVTPESDEAPSRPEGTDPKDTEAEPEAESADPKETDGTERDEPTADDAADRAEEKTAADDAQRSSDDAAADAGGFDWFTGGKEDDARARDTESEDADGDDAASSVYSGESAFKDSGSFFRDGVARNLAEQYGLEFAGGSTADGPEADEAPAEPRDLAGSADSVESAAKADSDTEQESSADRDDTVGERADEPNWDPEGTAEFRPVFDDDDEDEDVPAGGVGASGRAGGASEADGEDAEASTRMWDPEGTAEFRPVFDDDDEDEDVPAGGVGASGRAGGASEADGEDAEASTRAWDPEGTAAFTPVFDDDEDDEKTTESPAHGAASSPHDDTERDTPAPADPGTEALGTAAVAAAGAVAGAGVVGGAIGAQQGAGTGGSGTPSGETSHSAASGGADPQGPAPTGDAKGKAKKAKKKAQKKQRPLWWRITRGGLIAAGILLVLGVAGFGVAYATIPVPDATQESATNQGSTFYYSDGETVFAERGVDRDPVPLEEVPEEVQNAILAAEDRGFWTEPGVSLTGTLRAAWSTFTGQQVQGGSTITQQMVRNYYEGLSQEQTYSRKFKEIIISLKVDRSQSKEWILEQYLNTIYFGRNAYGIQAAAQAYYHKDVGELTPDEAALLAAAIQQPTKFGLSDSETTPEMEERWRYVVDGLVQMESITPAQADQYRFPKPEKTVPQEGVDLSGYKGYMLQQAMKELEQLGYTEDNINRGGYKITTTFDKDLMEAAQEAVEENVDVEQMADDVRIGLSAVDPATGEVVAFYGGADYMQNQYDSAFLGTAQVGSSFKPYVLAAALKNDMGLNTVVDGSGPQTIAGSRVQNAGNAPGGPMNLIEATRVSNNLGYIDLAQRVGLEEVAQTAYEMGIPEGSLDDHLVPVMPLGVNDTTPTVQAGAYATFANGGEHVETHVIRSILNVDGEEERPEVERNRVLSEEQAADATYAMQNVVNAGTGRNAAISRPAAGKTGTTDNNVAAWFVGYTPRLATAATAYNTNKQTTIVPGWGVATSDGVPSAIWRSFMEKAADTAYGEYAEFPSPAFGGSSQNYAPQVPSEPQSEETGGYEEAPPVEEDLPQNPAPDTGVEIPDGGATGAPVDPGTDPGGDPGGVDPGGDPGGTDPGGDPGGTDPGGDPGTGFPGGGGMAPTG
ncbi:transglycosylase domain-containing protein [Marinactinospora thermotolerans]|uniref:Membrane carboxypeptidase (Penicillin-binding protein) n=1 Tax=Marinactinospora thermotolerans DSM 45154 TaxID=1122192 RepID=A0A1T4SET3_9ACTN|nr:transglycosylase domain-containing protein [Marinactinospora thermotolerans]SKA26351.1 Membrane carboxypeptidase (penicillin-binding protein) [Marinactinospora thermotolerans DSM 45154]